MKNFTRNRVRLKKEDSAALSGPVTRIPTSKKYRVSGHESFSCRYSWLPKAMNGLRQNPKLFADEAEAMVLLGVGKNMARSIRFWAQAAGIVKPTRTGGYQPTAFGFTVFGERGRDPFLEDIRTLWLLHWNLASDVECPLLAWDYLMNRWQDPELVGSVALRALEKEAMKENDGISRATVEQHFDVFLHTYVPTRGRKGEVHEDNLDCPLVELEFVVKVGERELDRFDGKREPIYAFRRDEKPEITPELFTYCLYDFWNRRHKTESTLPFHEVANGHASPGQVFKLAEEDVRHRLELLAAQSDGLFSYSESTNLQQIRRHRERKDIDLLKEIYSAELVHA